MEEKVKKRIMIMEACLNDLEKVLKQSKATIEQLENSLSKYEKLKEYYVSPEWRQDFEASNQPDFPSPKELPHGVLSEDAVYSLMIEFDELANKLKAVGNQYSNKIID